MYVACAFDFVLQALNDSSIPMTGFDFLDSW